MSDTEAIKIVREAMSLGVGSEITDQEVDQLMAEPSDVSQGTLKRMRTRFVDKVFERLFPEPTRQVNGHITFGQWINTTREKARLTRSLIATALKKSTSFVEQVEKETIFPWQMSASDAAKVAILFRLHFDALVQLTSNSADNSSCCKDLNAAPLTSKGALETPKVAEWQDAVRIEILLRHATHLLE